MTRTELQGRAVRIAGFAAGFVLLAGLAAAGTAGWALHGERIWLAMADGVGFYCF